MKKILVAAAFTALLTPAYAQTTIAGWTFETAPPADLLNSSTSPIVSADVGLGTASGVHVSANTDWTTPVGNGSANSFSANEWAVGDYFQFQVSTVGFTDIAVSYDQTSSNTGPRDYELRYSTDGVNFDTFAAYSVLANAAPNSWTSGTYLPIHTSTHNLSSITALNNAAAVYFRLVDVSTVSANNGTVAAAGTDRVDNFVVTATAVPEPSTYALMGLAGAALLWRRRKA